MQTFSSDGVQIAFEVHGEGRPVLLVHGFGSSGRVNWVETGWVETLRDAGFQPVTFDNRGHGESEKLYDAERYYPRDMAGDALRLLDHLGVERCAVMGYSMGARIAAFLALDHPERTPVAVWGGMGLNLVTGLEGSETIIEGLLADRLEDVTDPTARQFRIFADHNSADRAALAACMVNSRQAMPEADVRRIATPVLVATGENDAMAGAAEALAALLPHGEGFTIPRRDHMRATGDPELKRAALDFLARH